MSTAAELAAYLNRTGILSMPTGDGFKVPITVIDAREIFGRRELKVTPVGGSGHVWATVQTVELNPTTAKEEAKK